GEAALVAVAAAEEAARLEEEPGERVRIAAVGMEKRERAEAAADAHAALSGQGGEHVLDEGARIAGRRGVRLVPVDRREERGAPPVERRAQPGAARVLRPVVYDYEGLAALPEGHRDPHGAILPDRTRSDARAVSFTIRKHAQNRRVTDSVDAQSMKRAFVVVLLVLVVAASASAASRVTVDRGVVQSISSTQIVMRRIEGNRLSVTKVTAL